MTEAAPAWLRGRGYWLAVAAILALAAVLRFYRLGEWSLWVDEGATYLRASTGRLTDQGPMYSTAPLNFVVTGWVIRLMGATPFWLRFFPAVCGIAGVGALIWSGTLLASRGSGLIAGLLLAISPWHIEWSQNARHFSPAFLFMTVAFAAFFSFWESGKTWWLPLTALAAGLGLATHSSSAFALVAMGAYAGCLVLLPRFRGVVTRAKVVGTVATFAAIALTYIPIALSVSSYLGEHKPAWNSPANVAESIAFYAGPLPLFLAGAVGLLESKAGRRGALLALQWLAWPIALAVLAATRTISSNAYALVSLGGMVVLLGLGIERLWTADAASIRAMGTVLLIGLAAKFGSDTWLYYTKEQGNRPPWREATAWIAHHAAPNDSIFATEGIPVGYYLGNVSRGRWLDQWRPPGPGETQWLLVLEGRGALPESALTTFLDRDCTLREVFYRNTGPKRRDIEAYRCGTAPKESGP